MQKSKADLDSPDAGPLLLKSGLPVDDNDDNDDYGGNDKKMTLEQWYLIRESVVRIQRHWYLIVEMGQCWPGSALIGPAMAHGSLHITRFTGESVV